MQRGEAKQNRFHCPVSILYEAGRLCNDTTAYMWASGKMVSILYEAGRLLRGRQTLQPRRLTASEIARMVSILYEAGRLCNELPELFGERFFLCFNPLRGRQTLQHEPVVLPLLEGFQSSTRQADFATWWPRGRWWRPACFNPLRGRQTLQPTTWSAPCKRPSRRFNPLRGRQTLQLEVVGTPWARARGFNPLRGRQTLQQHCGC